MSLQDDIFDVRAALESSHSNTGEVELFDHICTVFFQWERERDACLGALHRVKEAQDTLKAFCALDIPIPPS